MPVYDYKCPGCGALQEVTHSSEEKPRNLACLKCGTPGLRRFFGNIFFVKKGAVLENPGNFATPPSRGSCSTCGGGSCSTCSN